jgi:hypothetical protein
MTETNLWLTPTDESTLSEGDTIIIRADAIDTVRGGRTHDGMRATQLFLRGGQEVFVKETAENILTQMEPD